MPERKEPFKQRLEIWRGKWFRLLAALAAFDAAATRILTPPAKYIAARGIRFLKWCRKRSTVLGIAKLAAICATIGGTATALDSVAATSSMSTGLALTAAGAGSYVAIKGIPVKGYEITKHVPPRAAPKPPVNMYKTGFSSTRISVSKRD